MGSGFKVFFRGEGWWVLYDLGGDASISVYRSTGPFQAFFGYNLLPAVLKRSSVSRSPTPGSSRQAEDAEHMGSSQNQDPFLGPQSSTAPL